MNQYFLELLNNETHNQPSQYREVDYVSLYQLASQHQVSAMIFNQIFSFSFNPELKNYWKKEALRINVIQATKTDRFLRLYETFIQHHLKVLVVKGIICRALYPHPDARQSNDEDLYIEKQYLQQATDLIVSEGFEVVSVSDDVTTFLDPKCGLSLELHTSLFNTDTKTFNQYQSHFNNVFDECITHQIQGTDIYSLSYNQHLLFLILHFVKHFLHGGVGIRQILDIIKYSEAYNQEIDWNSIKDTCMNLNILELMQNVFALAHDYFNYDIPTVFISTTDYQDLLDDILDAGIFGKSSEERLHSSTMTLNALEDGKTSVLKSIFQI